MTVFILWFAVLMGICGVTKGWGRAFAVSAYILGSILVAL